MRRRGTWAATWRRDGTSARATIRSTAGTGGLTVGGAWRVIADGADGQPDGDGGGDAGEVGPPLMAEQSFTVAATVTFRPQGPGAPGMMPHPP